MYKWEGPRNTPRTPHEEEGHHIHLNKPKWWIFCLGLVERAPKEQKPQTPLGHKITTSARALARILRTPTKKSRALSAGPETTTGHAWACTAVGFLRLATGDCAKAENRESPTSAKLKFTGHLLFGTWVKRVIHFPTGEKGKTQGWHTKRRKAVKPNRTTKMKTKNKTKQKNENRRSKNLRQVVVFFAAELHKAQPAQRGQKFGLERAGAEVLPRHRSHRSYGLGPRS